MDEKLHELRRRLDQKTTEIETVVAAERGIGSIENMDPSDYERLQQDVEELLRRWEETAQEQGLAGWALSGRHQALGSETDRTRILLASWEVRE